MVRGAVARGRQSSNHCADAILLCAKSDRTGPTDQPLRDGGFRRTGTTARFAMTLPIHSPFPPMEALSVEEVPLGDEWQYEPKWDGFRCVAFRDATKIELQSKAGQPLARYFPEVVERIAAVDAKRFVLDGELAIPSGTGFSFDDLLLRLHPAESRVRKLAASHPAIYIVFDL